MISSGFVGGAPAPHHVVIDACGLPFAHLYIDSAFVAKVQLLSSEMEFGVLALFGGGELDVEAPLDLCGVAFLVAPWLELKPG